MKTKGPATPNSTPPRAPAKGRVPPAPHSPRPAREALTWRRGAAARPAAGAAAAAKPTRPWPCGLCAGQVRPAPALAKLLRLWPRGSTRRAGARRREARAPGEDGSPSPPRPAPPRAPVPPPRALPASPWRLLRAPKHPVVALLHSLSLAHAPCPLHCPLGVRRPRPSECYPCCQQTGSSTCLPGAQAMRGAIPVRTSLDR